MFDNFDKERVINVVIFSRIYFRYLGIIMHSSKWTMMIASMIYNQYADLFSCDT